MAEHKTACWMGPLLKGTRAQRDELERTIMVALRSAHGNLTSAAALLEVHVATLARYVDRLGLGAVLEQARGSVGARVATRRRMRAVGRKGGRPRRASI